MIRESIIDTALHQLNQGTSLEAVKRGLSLSSEEEELIIIAVGIKKMVGQVQPHPSLASAITKKGASLHVTEKRATRYPLYARIKSRLVYFRLWWLVPAAALVYFLAIGLNHQPFTKDIPQTTQPTVIMASDELDILAQQINEEISHEDDAIPSFEEMDGQTVFEDENDLELLTNDPTLNYENI